MACHSWHAGTKGGETAFELQFGDFQ